MIKRNVIILAYLGLTNLWRANFKRAYNSSFYVH